MELLGFGSAVDDVSGALEVGDVAKRGVELFVGISLGDVVCGGPLELGGLTGEEDDDVVRIVLGLLDLNEGGGIEGVSVLLADVRPGVVALVVPLGSLDIQMD